jgi:hypothetical protein
MNITFEFDKFKIIEDDVKFNLTKSSKTGKDIVVCNLGVSIFSPVARRKKTKNEKNDSYGPYIFASIFNGTRSNYMTVTSRAVLSDNDEFSVEKGKKIALAKAESMVYAKLAKALEKNFNDYTNVMKARLDDFSNKAKRVEAHNAEYIESIA